MQVTNLRAYLANVGMTMKDFAKKIACNRTYLARIVSGESYAGHRLAQDIFEATGGVIKMPTKNDQIKEEQHQALLKLKQGGAGNIPTYMANTMMTHFESFDEHKQD